jgi:CRP-like cAMP-binding protein
MSASELRRDPAEALKASAIFGGLDAAMRAQVLTQAVSRAYPRGAAILRRGDPGTGMVLVLTGRVRIGITSEDGREVTLGILGPGDVLGEMALLDGEERSADAIALEDCSVLVLERGRFLRLLRDTPDLALRLLVVLTERLRRANAAIEDIALMSLEGRLARLLSRLGEEYGRAVPHGTRIELKLSQKDLSALVGGSREKVNRRLRLWEEEGTIAKENGYLILRQPDRLRAFLAVVD